MILWSNLIFSSLVFFDIYRKIILDGYHWVEYRNPIDLIDRPSNMEIGLCSYQKGQQQVDWQSY